MTEEELKTSIALILAPLDNPKSSMDTTLYYADRILALIREAGWMDVDMVKGLIFEMQAKKCAQCKVTGSI